MSGESEKGALFIYNKTFCPYLTSWARQPQTFLKNGGRVVFRSKSPVFWHLTLNIFMSCDAGGFADSHAIYRTKIASAVCEKSAFDWAETLKMKNCVGHIWWHHNVGRIAMTKDLLFLLCDQGFHSKTQMPILNPICPRLGYKKKGILQLRPDQKKWGGIRDF